MKAHGGREVEFMRKFIERVKPANTIHVPIDLQLKFQTKFPFKVSKKQITIPKIKFAIPSPQTTAKK